MVQVNLLPDIKKQLLHAQMQRNLVVSICIITSIAAGSVIVLLGGIMGGQALQKNGLTQSIEEKANTIAKEQNSNQLDEYLTIQNQLSKISSLKSQQLNYSRMFDYLKELNPAAPNNAALSSMKVVSPGVDSGIITGTATTTGVAVEMQGKTANYSSLNVFKNTLALTKFSYAPSKGANIETKLLFTSVNVTSTSLSTDGVSFTLQAVFDPAIFGSDSVDIKLDIPKGTTSDSDRNAPGSDNIFTTEPTKPSSSATEGDQ